MSVVLIDLVLAGDNAIVVGMAAAGLPKDIRRKAIVAGIGAAALLRIVFAIFTSQLLHVIGVGLAGGLLLLWVCWKLFRETRRAIAERHGLAMAPAGMPGAATRAVAGDVPRPTRGAKTLPAALLQIVVADVSMSLDNVLAVAGAARDHTTVLVLGLALSVALMGVAASIVAAFLHRYPWVAYLGLALIAWVAVSMIMEGGHQVFAVASGTHPS